VRPLPSPRNALGATALMPLRVSGSDIADLSTVLSIHNRRSGIDTKIDSSGGLIGKIDLAKAVDAAAQESRAALRGKQYPVRVEKFRARGIDIDAPIALDVQRSFDAENIECVVVAVGDRPRTLAEAHRIVQKFELNALVATDAPR